jgi:hypothetical protein
MPKQKNKWLENTTSSHSRKSNVRTNYVPFLILVFPKGKDKKEPVAYEQGRSEQDFVGYLNDKAGTYRVAGGGLTESAGRIVDLDALAGELSAAVSEAEKSSVYTQLEQVLSKLTSAYLTTSFSQLTDQRREILRQSL